MQLPFLFLLDSSSLLNMQIYAYYISLLIHVIILASLYYPNNGSCSVILDYKTVSLYFLN